MLLVFGSFANISAHDKEQQVLVSQAKNMASLLIAKNYAAFSEYLYPGIVMLAGSKEKLIAATQNAMDQMAQGGMTITKITFSSPAKILVVGSEWQTTIPQVLEVTYDGKTITSEYSMIAISNNKGKHWYFVDTSGKDLATLRKSLPNLSTELVVPERKQRTQ